MRDNMPVILFGLLIAFLITIIFEWGMDYMGIRAGASDVVGEVNGSKVTYKEFTDLLRTFTDNQKAQTGVEPDENQLKQAREQVWESMVTQILLKNEIERLGISVTDQELVDWVRGDDPPVDLRRNFVDSAGQFRKDLYDQFLNNPNQFLQDPQGSDPAYGTKWLANYEESLRQRRAQEKLQSLILASVRVSEGELLRRFTDQSQQFDALYALFDATSLVTDADVDVTDADLRTYYEENLDRHRFEATRKLKYVQFKEDASPTDSTEIKSEIEDVAGKAANGIDFMELVYTYDQTPDSGAFFKHGELNVNIDAAVFDAKVGDVVGPILETDGYHLIKVLDERKSEKEFLHASHILFSLEGEEDVDAVKAEAQQVAKVARGGEDFAGLARQYSKDPGSASRGGDLGWFTRGRMVKPFEEAVFRAKRGQIIGPIRTQFGFHVIKVHARDARELKIVDILIPITASSQTKNDVFERATDFAYNAAESEFVKEAQASGFEVKESQIQEKGGVVPGIGINERITRWAFNERVGSVSEPFTVPNGYAVFMVAEAKDAGIRPFDEVKESLEPQVLREKKNEKVQDVAADLQARLSSLDSLTKLEELNPKIKARRTGTFALNGSVPGVGRDQNFLGAVAALSVGQISAPVRSVRGAFLIQLLSKTELDSAAFAAQEDVLRTQMLKEKRDRFLRDWLAKLKDDADIEDNRDIFFR
jgi:parvulin-like peptidyl-prolyl isomerase